MDSEICKKCGGILVVGKGEEEIFWCPKCEGLIVESIEESKNKLQGDIKEHISEIYDIIKKYSLEGLLETIYITREGLLHLKPPETMKFMAYSDLIKIIAESKKFGNKKIDPRGIDIQTLLRLAESLNSSKKMLFLLRHGWIRTIKLRIKDIPKYAYELEKAKIVDDKIPESFEREDMSSIIKFIPQWMSIKKNLEENGFNTANELIDFSQTGKSYSELKKFWYCIYTKVSLELGAGNFSLLELKNLKNSLDYIQVLDKVIEEYPFDFNFQLEKGWRNFSCNLEPVDIVKTFYPFFKKGLDINHFGENFIATLGNCKGFPIFLLTRNGLFMGPYTAILLSRFLKAKYFRNYLDANSNIGNEFESQVALELVKNGFSLNQPNDGTKKMINIKDDYKNPTLEIDIVAYYKKKIYIIECKNIVISTEFLTNNREETVKKNIKNEPEKQKRRITFIKNNLKKWGYSPKINIFHNILITSNREPIEKIDETRIFSIKDIAKLKDI
mgnify:CR=1 FL=1